MALVNTETTYGTVTKSFHWATALLILVAIPLGFYAHSLPYDSGEELARKALWFSVHKTVGVTAFVVALARIAWALSQPKPGLLNAGRPAERIAAETVHWLLYASLVIVPLSGWLHHAATEGFAPIWWPFGQSLPLVPKSDAIASFFAAWHWIFVRVLIAVLVLHVAGALKHAVIDRDGTLARMLPGRAERPVPRQPDDRVPAALATLVLAVAIGAGSAIGVETQRHAAAMPAPVAETDRPAAAGNWAVESGSLAITVVQLGSQIDGAFSDWSADITFDEEAADGRHGRVDVAVRIGSLTLGSVTEQALNPGFLAAEEFPTAHFSADILAAADGYVADGTLTLRGRQQPVRLPFELRIDGDVARMTGSLRLDRRDFGVGADFADEASVENGVGVEVALTARRAD